MQKGQELQVRREGATEWVPCVLEIVSPNHKSLAVSSEAGLASPGGLALDLTTGRQLLLLLKQGDGYVDVMTGARWEIQAKGGDAH